MQEVAIALESYRQKKPCATLHPWLGCESLDRQLFSFEVKQLFDLGLMGIEFPKSSAARAAASLTRAGH
jgi:hypothetical protein